MLVSELVKIGIALMGHNTTGPPWSVTDDDDRCQQALLVWTTYTGMCRQTSNNM